LIEGKAKHVTISSIIIGRQYTMLFYKLDMMYKTKLFLFSFKFIESFPPFCHRILCSYIYCARQHSLHWRQKS